MLWHNIIDIWDTNYNTDNLEPEFMTIFVAWQSRVTVLRCFGQVMSPHHSDQMSQRLQVSRIALWRCSLNAFVFVIVFVFVFVIVIVFLLVRSCLLITLITLRGCSLNVFAIACVLVSVIVFWLVRSYLLITLIKCLKGHKSLGSLFEGAL